MFQRLSILIQHFNSVLNLESYISTDDDPDRNPPVILILTFVFNLRDLYYLGSKIIIIIILLYARHVVTNYCVTII